jgi:hypothetical protein
MTLTAACLALVALSAAPVHLGAAADARSVVLVVLASARGHLAALGRRGRELALRRAFRHRG